MDLIERYRAVRDQSLKIVSPLETEDHCIQSCEDVSPPKWHLAHTTWFFERLILEKFIPDYQAVDPIYYDIFNSYYESLGSLWERPKRGVLSRPTVKEVMAYRQKVDERIIALLQRNPSDSELRQLMILGFNHEQQHQELLFMDIKSNFFSQAQSIKYQGDRQPTPRPGALPLEFIPLEGGTVEIGQDLDAKDFCYDNETPKHRVWVPSFSLANRLVTNEEYLEFIEDDGYQKHDLWLSEGWTWVQKNSLRQPLYWLNRAGAWREFGFYGLQELDLHAPVAHLSYFEANAYARYRQRRLPTEFEWELTAQRFPCRPEDAGFLNPENLTPLTADKNFADLHGTLWQWTQSAYLPYPRHRWVEGALGEYNSKFMINQMVLRGGCFCTEKNHYRISYRNYFHAQDRWPFTGLRLAEDL